MHIRTGMRSSWLVVAAMLLASLALLPVGCGGGSTTPGGGSGSGGSGSGGSGGGGGPVIQYAKFRVAIDWGARTRVVGLSSALSARIRLAGADKDGKDIVWDVQRPASAAGASVKETYLSPTQAVVGNHILTVRFFSGDTPPPADPDDANAETRSNTYVGFAQASASVLANESTVLTISTYTGVQTVRVIPGQSVEVGKTKDLAFEAKNPDGAVVALSHASAFFTVTSGAANLEVVDNGAAVRGKRPIEAFVTVRIDNATSPAEKVAVTSQTALAVSPTDATIGSEFPLDLTATVTGAPETDVTFRIQGGTGNGALENVTPTSATFVAPKVTGSTVKTINIEVWSNYDSVKRTVIPVTVNAPATVTITPASPELSLEESVNLTAVVNNLSPRFPADDARRGVTWKVLADGSGQSVGKVTKDGVYTAPKREGTFTVEATSVYDPSKKATVAIKVESQVAVTIAPNPAPTQQWEDVLNLTATVARTPNQQVTWTLTSPSGFASALASTGASTARFTAPKKNGTYVVRATSVYDNRKSFSLAIEVSTNVVVSVTPTPVRMSVKTKKQFDKTVTGLPPGKTDAVTWSITGPNGEPNTNNVYGTIDSVTGLYSAPATVAKNGAGKLELALKVVATSNYDPDSKAAAVVTVVGGSLGVDVN